MGLDNELILQTIDAIELFFAVHFGTYTKDATVKISEVFDVFKNIKTALEEKMT